jgi:hypothetical protein
MDKRKVEIVESLFEIEKLVKRFLNKCGNKGYYFYEKII